MSVVFHSLIVFFAVYATARAGIPADDDSKRAEKVTFVKKVEQPPPPETKPEPPKPKAPVKPKAAPQPAAPKAVIAPPKGFQVLAAPVVVPTKIPDIDLSAKVTNEADFTGRGTPGGSSTGTEGAAAPAGIDTDRNYAEFEVERVVAPLSGVSIPYPETMRASGVEGEVLAEFVVNESGRVDLGSFKILSSSNDEFSRAVRNALPKMRFRPAQIGKTNVAQVVHQSFRFKLNR